MPITFLTFVFSTLSHTFSFLSFLFSPSITLSSCQPSLSFSVFPLLPPSSFLSSLSPTIPPSRSPSIHPCRAPSILLYVLPLHFSMLFSLHLFSLPPHLSCFPSIESFLSPLHTLDLLCFFPLKSLHSSPLFLFSILSSLPPRHSLLLPLSLSLFTPLSPSLTWPCPFLLHVSAFTSFFLPLPFSSPLFSPSPLLSLISPSFLPFSLSLSYLFLPFHLSLPLSPLLSLPPS